MTAPRLRSSLSARPGRLAQLGMLLVSLLAATPCFGGLQTWTTGGPIAAPPIPLGHSLAIDPTTPSILYATVYGGGVHKSADGGASWTPINSGLPSLLGMAIVVDPVTPSTVYVTLAPSQTTVGGAFKSTNGGGSWDRVSNGLPSGPFGGAEASNSYQSLTIDPRSPSVLYAGSGSTVGAPALVYKTQNGGASWTLMNNGLAGATFAGAFAVHPANSSILYVGTSTGGVFGSTNGGATWLPLNDGLTQLFTTDLAINPFAPTTVYVGTISGLFKSTNAGGSWAPVQGGLPGGRVNAVVFDPAHAGTVYASATCCGVYRSTDSGATWTLMSGSPLAWTLAISPSGICLHAHANTGVWDFAFSQDTCAPTPPAQTTLAAAVLPSSRAVQVGTTATAFATILNTGNDPALSVGISLANPIQGATFQYNQTSCSTNAVIAGNNVPTDIPPGGQACYVIAIAPSAAFGPIEVAFAFAGTNTSAVPTLVGINTLLMLASISPTADLVALAATPAPNDGIVRIPGVSGTGVFAVAVANVGIGDNIVVSTNTGAAALPVNISLCQTDPVGGGCISAVGPTVTTFVGAGATATFGVFVAGTGGAIPLDPAANRVFFVLSRQSDGVIVGRTSVAVMTQ